MRTLRAMSGPILLVASLFIYAIAYGDAGGDPTATTAPFTPPSGWAGLAMIVLVASSWALRKATRSSSGAAVAFIHSTGGAAVSGLLSAVIPGLIQALRHGWDVQALQAAAVSGAFSYFALDNSSYSGDEQKSKVAMMKSNGGTSPPSPIINRVSVMLPFLFLAAALVGCVHATPAEKARASLFAACMESKGIAAAPDVATEVWNDLNGGTVVSTIETQLEALAAKAGTDAVACAASSWLNASTPQATGKLGAGMKNEAGVTAAKNFLQKRGMHAGVILSTGVSCMTLSSGATISLVPGANLGSAVASGALGAL